MVTAAFPRAVAGSAARRPAASAFHPFHRAGESADAAAGRHPSTFFEVMGQA
jgi:hypothetical protein